MTKFMNAELVAIRDNLTCGHCSATFSGSDSQAWKVKYEKRTVYCTSTCRHAAMSNKFRTPPPNRGPCRHCGKEFFSRTAKFYCSMDCYINSDQFKEVVQAAHKKSMLPEVRAAVSAARKKGESVSCLECGEDVYQKPSRRRKFCSTSCYRSYFAKRFDRWVANREGMALPECYDEFLDQESLPCLVDGCGWQGAHLSTHMNIAHGVPADEFKRAAGFNIGTGVIARPLAERLQQRPPTGVAVSGERKGGELSVPPTGPRGYVSAEAVEHLKKVRALALMEPGPERSCLGCGVLFRQSTPFGRTKYCTVECRDVTYSRKRKSARKSQTK